MRHKQCGESDTLDVPSVTHENNTSATDAEQTTSPPTPALDPCDPPLFSPLREREEIRRSTCAKHPFNVCPARSTTRAPKCNASTPSTCTTQGQTRGPPESTRAPLQRVPHRVLQRVPHRPPKSTQHPLNDHTGRAKHQKNTSTHRTNTSQTLTQHVEKNMSPTQSIKHF